MRRIYLACPYSDPDAAIREWRYQAVTRVAAMLIAPEVMVFSPISHSHPIVTLTNDAKLRSDYEYWMPFDQEMLDWADEMWILRLDGWDKSKGVDQEWDYAVLHGKAVHHIDPADYLGPDDNLYTALEDIFKLALCQASEGKGHERHAQDGERWEDQVWARITRRRGLGFVLGQADKKLDEVGNIQSSDGKIQELLDVMNYTAMAVRYLQEMDVKTRQAQTSG